MVWRNDFTKQRASLCKNGREYFSLCRSIYKMKREPRSRSVPGIVEHLSDEASRLSDVFVHYGTGYNLTIFSYLVQAKRTAVPEAVVIFTHLIGEKQNQRTGRYGT